MRSSQLESTAKADDVVKLKRAAQVAILVLVESDPFKDAVQQIMKLSGRWNEGLTNDVDDMFAPPTFDDFDELDQQLNKEREQEPEELEEDLEDEMDERKPVTCTKAKTTTIIVPPLQCSPALLQPTGKGRQVADQHS